MRPIVFVVFPHVMILDLAGAAEAFRIAGRLSTAGGAVTMRFVGPEAVVASSVGLQLAGIEPLPASLPDDAIVVLPGGRSLEAGEETPARAVTLTLVRWLRAVIRPTHLICTICSGALVAAEAGLLAGHRCTTHHTLCEQLARAHPDVKVESDRLFVCDGAVMSSAGITAGIDLSLYLISELFGPMTAALVAREMVVYLRRTPADPQISPWLQHRNHLHALVHRAQEAIVRDPSRPWSVEEVARVAHASPRHLTRLFREHAGVSVHSYVQHIRSIAARERIATTAWKRERVAESVGFSSARQMRRVLARPSPTPTNPS